MVRCGSFLIAYLRRIHHGEQMVFDYCFGVTFALTACGGESKIDPTDIGDPERVSAIFEDGGGVALACSKCHALEDGSDLDRFGPSLMGVAERAATRVPEMSAIDYLRESIVDPSFYLVEGYHDAMLKSYARMLSEEDLDAMIALMLTQ